MLREPPQASPFAGHWLLDPTVVYLNHGSFGATPKSVLEEQTRIRERLEGEPVHFLGRQLFAELDCARAELGAFVGARPDCLAFVDNATTGVNTVLRSIDIKAGDELVVTDHEYNACRNALEAVAADRGARIVVAPIPFPLRTADDVAEAVLRRVTRKTRLLLIDHVTSPTGMVLPIDRIIREASGLGVEILVDGAHAPGMVELDIEALGAAYYTGNCHKWICAPKGAAFLHVREDLRDGVRPLVISHGANAPVRGRSRFRLEHDWTGTRDPSAWLAVPAAIRVMAAMVDGGWPELRRRNHELAVEARKLLCEALSVDPPCPDSMIGSLASLPLPDADANGPVDPFGTDPLQEQLLREYAIEVPVIPWPSPPRRLIRISAQLYNQREQYEYLADALVRIIEPRSR